MKVSGFDWDKGNSAKCEKHGVSRSEVEDVFTSDVSIFPDLKHSGPEDRFIGIGQSKKGRYVFLAFTVRMRAGIRLIRPISARYMHQREIDYYEEKNTQNKK